MANSQWIGEALERGGINRRDFLEFCAALLLTAPAGLALTAGKKDPGELAASISGALRPPLIWLSLQSCSGCSETLLSTSAPGLDELILCLISLEYHPLLMAASGRQAESALAAAITKHASRYLLVAEGSVPSAEHSGTLRSAGRPASEFLREAASQAAAVIAIGSCASWGGIVSADPNPTGATGIAPYIGGRPLVNIPGCPPNPYVLTATLLEYAVSGKFPALDEKKRPLFAFDRLIHEHCPRRGHFDAGRLATNFGDEAHRHGYCLFNLGCKGPLTHAACSTRHFNEIIDCWPIGLGAPCFGCTEPEVAFRQPASQIVNIEDMES